MSMDFGVNHWIAFFILAGVPLIVDIIVHSKKHVIELKEAVCFSLFYVFIALFFAFLIYQGHGTEAATLFLTGYTLEKMLAFDNLFVFSLIFTYFQIPADRQHQALHWGIAGAIVFRLIFVFVGASLLEAYARPMEILFALMILLSVWLILKAGDDEPVDYDNTWYVRAIRKLYPGASIFFIAVCVIEISDVLFAFDSVPAIIAVTKEPFLIYTSMVFAILGLRSLYFVIAALQRYFRYMDTAVVVILAFIAFKLLLSGVLGIHIRPAGSLVFIFSALTVGILCSIYFKPEQNHEAKN